uniref:Uncharacterized protein n=1 Tax=Oryzias latipes TaxID=8090 RepID=A0A3B3HZR1_ORYLA
PGDWGGALVAQMERQLFSAVASTSFWLDGVESSVLSGSELLAETTRTLQQQETLQKDLSCVAEEVKLCESLLAGSSGLAEEDRTLLQDNLDCLQGRLSALGGALGQRCEHMRICGFPQTDLQLLQTALMEKKRQLLQGAAGSTDRPACEQLEVSPHESLSNPRLRIAELKSRGGDLQADQASTSNLLKLQDSYEDLVLIVASRRSGLNQNLAQKEQYERALQDLTDLLDTAKDKMSADGRVLAGSVEDVQTLLDKHKEFFQGLETHMVLTEAYFRKVSGLMLPTEGQALQETLAEAQRVLKEAHRRGVELEWMVQVWSRLEQDYQGLSRQLEALEGRTPSAGLEEESEERLTDRISLYQGLEGGLAEHQHKLHQLLDEGKHLLGGLSCPSLESRLAQLGKRWLDHAAKVKKERQRLEAVLKHWSRSGTAGAPMFVAAGLLLKDASPQVPESAGGHRRVAAVGSGAPGVLEHAGGVGPTGAGNGPRPPLCVPGETFFFL